MKGRCSYGGYTVKSVSKDDVSFSAPSGKIVKIAKKRIALAVNYSHKDISIVLKPEAAKEFIGCFGSAPYEPLFAILSTLDPTTYENYPSLISHYRFNELLLAIDRKDMEGIKSFADVLSDPTYSIDTIGTAVMKSGDGAILAWFFEHVPDESCNLNNLLYYAIEKDRKEIVDAILKKKLYNSAEKPSYDYPMRAAVKRAEYVLPLLENGFELASDEYLATLSLNQIKSLLAFRVRIGVSTLNRIVEEKRFDILTIIESDAERFCDKMALIEAYITAGDEDRFKKAIQGGWFSNTATEYADSLLEQAYDVSAAWADLILERGYDINRDSANLLRQACLKLKVDFAIYLVEHGANPRLKGDHSCSVLEAAAYPFKAPTVDMDAKEKLVRYLIDVGCDPVMDSGSTPSIFSRLMDMPTDFKVYLVDVIADRGELNYYECQNDKSKSDKGLLESVIGTITGHYDSRVFRRMLERGILVDAAGRSRSKLFLDACTSCPLEDLKLFLEAGCNIKELDNNFKTNGLYSAVSHKQSKEVIEYLISLGLDVNSMSPGSQLTSNYSVRPTVPPKTVLDIAERNGDQAVISVLKKNGAKTAAEIV